jgi:hypothetical protein
MTTPALSMREGPARDTKRALHWLAPIRPTAFAANRMLKPWGVVFRHSPSTTVIQLVHVGKRDPPRGRGAIPAGPSRRLHQTRRREPAISLGQTAFTCPSVAQERRPWRPWSNRRSEQEAAQSASQRGQPGLVRREAELLGSSRTRSHPTSERSRMRTRAVASGSLCVLIQSRHAWSRLRLTLTAPASKSTSRQRSARSSPRRNPANIATVPVV